MKLKSFLQLTLFFLLCSLQTVGWAETSGKPLKLLAFSGSVRADSYNKKALMLLIESLKGQGATVTYIDLADFPMPIYNGDLEDTKGLPENAKKLQDLIAAHDGFIIASPEYNGLPSPLLINAIDWASREVKGNANSGLNIFKDKPATIIAVSPGKSGGSRGMAVVSQFLTNIGVKVAPSGTTIPEVMQVFNEKGQVKDQMILAKINNQAKKFMQIAGK